MKLRIHIRAARSYESCKNIQGPAAPICPFGAVTSQALFKTFSPDHFGQVEIIDSTMLRNKTITA